MTEQATPEAIEAALALVNRMDKMIYTESSAREDMNLFDEARRIAAMLPNPVDPVVRVCREILAKQWGRNADKGFVLSGGADHSCEMALILAGYHAGAAATKGRG